MMRGRADDDSVFVPSFPPLCVSCVPRKLAINAGLLLH